MIYQRIQPSAIDLNALADQQPVPGGDQIGCYHDVVVEKPWGSEYLLFENSDVAVWVLEIKPGQQTSMHCHPNKNTSLLVLGGQGICKTLETEYVLNELQGIYLGRQVFHQTQNPGMQSLFLVEIESPVDKFDLVRLVDSYGREALGYESCSAFPRRPGLSLEADLQGQGQQQRKVGDSQLTIGYAQCIDELISQAGQFEHAVLTVLDRHVWSDAGEKLVEVGQSFRAADAAGIESFRVNTGFHFLLITEQK